MRSLIDIKKTKTKGWRIYFKGERILYTQRSFKRKVDAEEYFRKVQRMGRR